MSEIQDGWDDDDLSSLAEDDVDDDEEDDSDEEESEEDSDEDDDDYLVDEDDDDDDDELESESDEEDDDEDGEEEEHQTPRHLEPPGQGPSVPTLVTPSRSSLMKQHQPQQSPPQQQHPSHLPAKKTTAASAAQPRPPPPLPIYHELIQYLEIMPHLSSSINALLEAEHNSNPAKAWDMVQYYQDRPGLVDYTLEKELPRMQYTWMDPYTGEPIQEKSTIAKLFVEEAAARKASILPRCANQSLLADLLEYLSGSQQHGHDSPQRQRRRQDGLIRQRFHMACQTDRVEFILEPAESTVLVKATLQLTLPHPNRGMISIATVQASCQFAPYVPLWQYHLESVIPSPTIIQSMNSLRQRQQASSASSSGSEPDPLLLEVALFLQELNMHEEEEEEEPSSNKEGGDYRDAFLRQTADVWNQIQEAAGRVSSQTLSFPSHDLLEQARLEEEAHAAAETAARKEQQQQQQVRMAMMQQQQQQPHHPPYMPHDSIGHTNQYQPPPPASSSMAFPRPPPPNEEAEDNVPTERPKSILGGMFSRIAKSVVALPEEDPSMYDEWRQDPPPAPAPIMPEWPGRLQPNQSRPNNNNNMIPDTRDRNQKPGSFTTTTPPPPPPQTKNTTPQSTMSSAVAADNRIKSSPSPASVVEKATVATTTTSTFKPTAILKSSMASKSKNSSNHPNQKLRQERHPTSIMKHFSSKTTSTNSSSDGTNMMDGWENDDLLLALEEEDEEDIAQEDDDNNNDDDDDDDEHIDEIDEEEYEEEEEEEESVEEIIVVEETEESEVDSHVDHTSDEEGRNISRTNTIHPPQASKAETSPTTFRSSSTAQRQDPPSLKTAATTRTATTAAILHKPKMKHAEFNDVVDENWVYDPETDIIPTRKRWVNPRPGPRILSQLRRH